MTDKRYVILRKPLESDPSVEVFDDLDDLARILRSLTEDAEEDDGLPIEYGVYRLVEVVDHA